MNIHDGKQRLLSLYYFIQPTASIEITTIRNGKKINYEGLTQVDKDYLLNYTIDIVERIGGSIEEERSFYLLNTNSVNLTMYECLSGMYHGTFLDEFETYIDIMSKNLNNVKPVGRGEQAYKLLHAVFNIPLIKTKEDLSNIDNSLNEALKPVRYNSFDAGKYAFDEIIICFNDLMTAVKGLKDERAIAVANYIIRNGYDAVKVVNAYRIGVKQDNDMNAWDIATHKAFIDALINGVTLCPKRFFGKDTKDTLYARSPRCAHIDANGQRCNETSYNKLEVDHIVPWSKGGQTIIGNAQLLCKTHNAGKGNRP